MTAVALAVLSLLGGSMLAWTAIAARRGVSATEERVFERVNRWPDSWYPVLGTLMQFGTYVTTPVLAAVVWVAIGPAPAVLVGVCGTLAWIGAKFGKALTRRGRPRHALTGDVHVRGPVQSGEGYPSGHAAVSASLGVTLGLALGGWWWPLLVALAAITALARLYVGAHLPLDVLGGVGLGLLLAGAGGVLSVAALG